MRYAVISDVHASLEALEACLDDINKRQIDKLLFIGDIVGYGPDPDACLELLVERAHICLAGNHDYAVLGLTDILYFNKVAKAAVLWTRENFKPENKVYLERWDLTAVINDMCLVHASPFKPESWYYIFTIKEAGLNFNHFDTQICFVGHSHVPSVFVRDDNDSCYKHEENMLHLQADYKYIINVGSVGQPRDGNPDGCYAIYDSSKKRVEFIRVAYDVTRVQRKIIAAGLPHFLAHRLSRGQ